MTIVQLCVTSCNRFIVAPAALLLLAGCGYKGPLYLPPPPDTLNEGQASEQRQPDIPPQQQNPSLEPAPIVIE